MKHRCLYSPVSTFKPYGAVRASRLQLVWPPYKVKAGSPFFKMSSFCPHDRSLSPRSTCSCLPCSELSLRNGNTPLLTRFLLLSKVPRVSWKSQLCTTYSIVTASPSFTFIRCCGRSGCIETQPSKILIPVFPTKCSRALVNAEPTARVLHTICFRVRSGFVDVGRRPTLPSHCLSLDGVCFRILLPFMLSNCPTNLGSNFSRRFCLKPVVITLPHLRM